MPARDSDYDVLPTASELAVNESPGACRDLNYRIV
jgi:hypothetical protein